MSIKKFNQNLNNIELLQHYMEKIEKDMKGARLFLENLEKDHKNIYNTITKIEKNELSTELEELALEIHDFHYSAKLKFVKIFKTIREDFNEGIFE
ncbi:MAG: hypothetical protein NTX05_07420 [Fusobacteria bacterium]|nr:hypothetical protein [Fusobacteriota bacterium]